MRGVGVRIGYPCINRSIGCKADGTFRQSSNSEARHVETVTANLDCLARILAFNRVHAILFFRVSSDTVPFASHPVLHLRLQSFFRPVLSGSGNSP
jgi:UV DNA damage endonuclease